MMKIRPYEPGPKLRLLTAKRDAKLDRRRQRLAVLARITNAPGNGGSAGSTRDAGDRRVVQRNKNPRAFCFARYRAHEGV
jgi:hypothetical protein